MLVQQTNTPPSNPFQLVKRVNEWAHQPIRPKRSNAIPSSTSDLAEASLCRAHGLTLASDHFPNDCNVTFYHLNGERAPSHTPHQSKQKFLILHMYENFTTNLMLWTLPAAHSNNGHFSLSLLLSHAHRLSTSSMWNCTISLHSHVSIHQGGHMDFVHIQRKWSLKFGNKCGWTGPNQHYNRIFCKFTGSQKWLRAELFVVSHGFELNIAVGICCV